MSNEIKPEDLNDGFVRKIDEALGVGEITKGPSFGAASGPSTGSIGDPSIKSTGKKKKRKKERKAAKIEDEVLESG